MKKSAAAFLIFLSSIAFLSFGRNVFFAYQARPGVKSVSLAGDFNGWSATATVLKNAFGGVWTVDVDLKDGMYLYDFVVDGKSVPDPANPKRKSDGKGGYYSIKIVGDFTMPTGKIGDGVIHKNNVVFKSDSRKYVDPASTKTVYFRIDTLRNDVNKVYFESGGETYPMKKIGLDDYTDSYRFEFHPASPEFAYKMVLVDGKTRLEVGSTGIATAVKPYVFDFASPTVGILNAPEWAKGAVVYEIFPDRFYDGSTSNDPEGTAAWDSTPTSYGFLGGDLEGITDKVGYLKDLGVDVLYTTPIFEAPSNHKYDTEDYMKVDPHFGNLGTFEKLLDSLHSNGIRWVLDGVFNHTGTDFFAFRDLLKNQENSRYKDWYFVKKYPVGIERGDYLTFQTYPSLPKLNVLNPEVEKYLKGAVDYWTGKGIDGWRMDSANVISNAFLTKLYGWIHAVNRNSLDVAEIWSNLSEWFDEGAFNSTMNYLFKNAAYSYILYGSGAKSFVNDTNSYLETYPPQLWDSLWNLIDSHDTERALTAAGGNIEKMKALVGLQMTFIGAPMIYYGDEIGMTGGDDPLDRAGMIWDGKMWNIELYDWYRTLIRVRNDTPEIRYGSYEPLIEDGDVFGFERAYEGNNVYVFINGSDKTESVDTGLTGTFRDLTGGSAVGSGGALKLTLRPYGVSILQK